MLTVNDFTDTHRAIIQAYGFYPYRDHIVWPYINPLLHLAVKQLVDANFFIEVSGSVALQSGQHCLQGRTLLPEVSPTEIRWKQIPDVTDFVLKPEECLELDRAHSNKAYACLGYLVEKARSGSLVPISKLHETYDAVRVQWLLDNKLAVLNPANPTKILPTLLGVRLIDGTRPLGEFHAEALRQVMSKQRSKEKNIVSVFDLATDSALQDLLDWGYVEVYKTNHKGKHLSLTVKGAERAAFYSIY